jgi:hypothetical protein
MWIPNYKEDKSRSGSISSDAIQDIINPRIPYPLEGTSPGQRQTDSPQAGTQLQLPSRPSSHSRQESHASIEGHISGRLRSHTPSPHVNVGQGQAAPSELAVRRGSGSDLSLHAWTNMSIRTPPIYTPSNVDYGGSPAGSYGSMPSDSAFRQTPVLPYDLGPLEQQMQGLTTGAGSSGGVSAPVLPANIGQSHQDSNGYGQSRRGSLAR